MCNECDYPLGYEPKKEPEKCHYEDGCKYDFFKELTAPYDVKNMQEFIAKIRAEAIDDVEKELMANGFIFTEHALDVWHDIVKKLKAGDKE